MKCPYCNKEGVRVLESRDINDGKTVRRRRVCDFCGKRFTTYEKFSENVLVKKKDKTLELYDSEKVKRGIDASTKKLSIDRDKIEEAINRVDNKVLEYATRHNSKIKSSLIGKYILEELKGISDVAAIRFASVYREFNTTEEFIKEIESLKDKSKT